MKNNRALALIFFSFGVYGLTSGMWHVTLPDLQQSLGLSPGELGAALTAGFIASLPMMVVGGRLVDRWGARGLISLAALLMALGMVGFRFVGGYWSLVALLLVFYAGFGAVDVGLNAAAIGIEQATGKRILILIHTAFSGFAGVGALAAGLLLSAGAPFRSFYVAAAIGMALVGLIIWRGLGRPAPAPAPRPAAHPVGNPWTRLRLPAALWLLAGVASLSMFSESTLETWSPIYLRFSLGLPVVVGAAGPAVFHFAMLIGRLGSGTMVGRLGRRRLLLAAGTAAAGGATLALATTFTPLILGGMLVCGLALSAIVPLTFSLAGDLTPERAGTASSMISVVGYCGPLIGPVLVGSLAEVAGLRFALGVLIVAGLLILALGSRVGETGHALNPAAAPEPEMM